MISPHNPAILPSARQISAFINKQLSTKVSLNNIPWPLFFPTNSHVFFLIFFILPLWILTPCSTLQQTHHKSLHFVLTLTLTKQLDITARHYVLFSSGHFRNLDRTRGGRGRHPHQTQYPIRSL